MSLVKYSLGSKPSVEIFVATSALMSAISSAVEMSLSESVPLSEGKEKLCFEW